MFLETLAQVFSCEFCKISKKTFSYRRLPVAGSVICNSPVQLRFIQVNFHHTEYGLWRSLEYSFCQINYNSSFLILRFVYMQYKVTRTSFFLLCVFIVLFCKNLIVLHRVNNNFLFYFEIHTFNNNLNHEEMITSHNKNNFLMIKISCLREKKTATEKPWRYMLHKLRIL